MRKKELNPVNENLVSVQNEEVIVMAPKARMSKERAAMFAAWLMTLSDVSYDDFKEFVDAVQGT
jgi:hypothetical protein